MRHGCRHGRLLAGSADRTDLPTLGRTRVELARQCGLGFQSELAANATRQQDPQARVRFRPHTHATLRRTTEELPASAHSRMVMHERSLCALWSARTEWAQAALDTEVMTEAPWRLHDTPGAAVGQCRVRCALSVVCCRYEFIKEAKSATCVAASKAKKVSCATRDMQARAMRATRHASVGRLPTA